MQDHGRVGSLGSMPGVKGRRPGLATHEPCQSQSILRSALLMTWGTYLCRPPLGKCFQICFAPCARHRNARRARSIQRSIDRLGIGYTTSHRYSFAGAIHSWP